MHISYKIKDVSREKYTWFIMWAYDNKQLLKFALIYFGFGSMLNFSFGLYVMSFNHVLNGILLSIVTLGISRILNSIRDDGAAKKTLEEFGKLYNIK